ncbi:MAG: VOC family protein [Thermoplasmata archaeon]|nr:VOC family protein [Thermoplasmata archaeon]
MSYEVRFMYSGIRVRNLERSVRFYRRLGFRVVKRGGFSHGGRWVHLVFPGSPHRIELNYYPPGTAFYERFRPGTEFDHFGFYVSDPRRWLRSVIRAGAKSKVGFVDGPAQLLFVEDPDGIGLCSCGPSSPGSLPTLFPVPRQPRTLSRKTRTNSAGPRRSSRGRPVRPPKRSRGN